MREIDLSQIRAVLFDMDGVIYRGNNLLPGVGELLDYLAATQRQWIYVTNNATRTPVMFVDKLRRLGIESTAEQILNSAEATASWLAENAPPGAKVQIIGQEGLWSALLHRGFEPAEDPFHADWVVVGLDFHLTYPKLADACLAIGNGAKFVGTNGDVSFPSERGDTPGAGALLALLESATGVAPEIIGKPYPGMFTQAMHQLGVQPHQVLMVGDRYETDIVGAVKLGLLAAGVLTGVTDQAGFAQADFPPQIITPGLPELLQLFQAADRG